MLKISNLFINPSNVELKPNYYLNKHAALDFIKKMHFSKWTGRQVRYKKMLLTTSF